MKATQNARLSSTFAILRVQTQLSRFKQGELTHREDLRVSSWGRFNELSTSDAKTLCEFLKAAVRHSENVVHQWSAKPGVEKSTVGQLNSIKCYSLSSQYDS